MGAAAHVDKMDRGMMSRWSMPAGSKSLGALFLAAVLLCACGGVKDWPHPQGVVRGEANIYPDNYKADILAFLRTYLNDPTQIRGAALSEPALKPGPAAESRYGVCVRFNARNAGGNYEGSKDRIVYFLAGRLDTMIEAKRDQCAGATYQPFPELEQLRR
jgi:hypothetical protein